MWWSPGWSEMPTEEERWEREDNQRALLAKGKLRRMLIRRHVPSGRGMDRDYRLAMKVVGEYLEEPGPLSSGECDALAKEWVGIT